MTRATVEQFSQTASHIALDVNSMRLTDEQFFQLCVDNRGLRLELTANGELVIMPPTGSKTGLRNSKINQRLANWAEADGTGETFDSSTGFKLPNGAKRSPDAAWIKRDRWQALTEEEQDKFAPICPDFVVELRSPDDTLATVKGKMAEYIENGARLGFLVDPQEKRVYVYRRGQPVETLENPDSVSGDPVLPGFALSLKDIL